MTKDKALKLALDFIERVNKDGWLLADFEPEMYAVITAIKAALEAKDDGITLTTIRHPRGKPALGDLNPESLEQVEIDLPEPIGYVSEGAAERLTTVKQAHEQIRSFRLFTHDVPVYALPQRTWVGLTDDEIWEAYMKAPLTLDCSTDELYALARTVEAKLKDKNNG